MTLLTVRAAAGRLGVAYSTVKQWIYSGAIRTTTTAGGHHRISDQEIDRLVSKTSPVPAARSNRGSGGTIVALSGRNRLHGFVDEIRIDGLLGQVRLRIGDQTLTAVITRDAIEELKLRRGDDAMAIIKSTEVMIAREAEPAGPAADRVRPRATGRRRASRTRRVGKK